MARCSAVTCELGIDAKVRCQARRVTRRPVIRPESRSACSSWTITRSSAKGCAPCWRLSRTSGWSARRIPHRPRWPRLWRCAPMWRCWMSGCPMGTGCRCAGEVRVRLPGVACLMSSRSATMRRCWIRSWPERPGTCSSRSGALICPARSAWPPPAVRCCLLARRARWWPGCGATLASPARWPRWPPQELGVLELIGEGLTNRQIGQRLLISEKTVRDYVSALSRKLGLEQRTQAAVYAARTLNDRTFEPGQHMKVTARNRKPSGQERWHRRIRPGATRCSSCAMASSSARGSVPRGSGRGGQARTKRLLR